MNPDTYEAALKYVADLAPRGWRLGLDRMQEFARRSGIKQGPKFVHVTGTNGKGSVTAFCQSLLIEQGYQTGAFFSPYVADPRERIQLNRDLISPEDFLRIVQELKPIGETMESTEFEGPTEFEFKTAMGFRYFEQKNCDWVALEVGLGGRLDATNIIDPAVSVIVSIGMDHTAILGETETLIASEKAGIIKPERPVVIGPMSCEAREVIERVATEKGAPIWRFGAEFLSAPTAHGWLVRTPNRELKGLKPGLSGPIQGVNLGVAIAALDAAGAISDESALYVGAARAFAPGRMQRVNYRGRGLILDGAHNAAAAQTLANSLQGEGRFTLLTSMVRGHDPSKFYEPLVNLVGTAIVGPIDFHRAQPTSTIAGAISGLGLPTQEFHTAGSALEAAMELNQPILVTGSFYWVGEILNLIQ
jgi:dihydrofolate synthase/folylpolyglutamate synthase